MDNAHDQPLPQVPRSPPSPDPLVATLAEPTAPPRPVTSGDDVLSAIATVGVALVALGGLMVAVQSGARHTAGATRSAHLEWERRAQQIEQTIQTEQPALPGGECPSD